MKTISTEAILYGELLEREELLSLHNYVIDPKGLALEHGYTSGCMLDRRQKKNVFSGGLDWAVRADSLPREWIPESAFLRQNTITMDLLDELFIDGFGTVSMFPCDLSLQVDTSAKGEERTHAAFTSPHLQGSYIYSIDQVAAIEQMSQDSNAQWYLANNLRTVAISAQSSTPPKNHAMFLISENSSQLLAKNDDLLGVVW